MQNRFIFFFCPLKNGVNLYMADSIACMHMMASQSYNSLIYWSKIRFLCNRLLLTTDFLVHKLCLPIDSIGFIHKYKWHKRRWHFDFFASSLCSHTRWKQTVLYYPGKLKSPGTRGAVSRFCDSRRGPCCMQHRLSNFYSCNVRGRKKSHFVTKHADEHIR